MSSSPRHFLDLSDHSPALLRELIERAKRLKKTYKATGTYQAELSDKTLALIFDKPSTRTRVSFDLAMRQLGGDCIMLTGQEMQLGRGETISDTAKVLSRYVDAIMIRILEHENLLELAQNATIPVINGLTTQSHPCQVMADILTFEEHRGDIAGKKIAWIGDTNNVLTSWVHAAPAFDVSLYIATPWQYAPDQNLQDWIEKHGENKITLTNNPIEAANQADCIITDTWVSMGDEDIDERMEILKPFQINTIIMQHAKSDALFMHCLPAHRGEEVTDEIIDGKHSVVFDEAENRLHAQKAILHWCFKG